MSHDPLRDALKALPRDRAPLGFTRRVVERLDEEPRRTASLLPGWAVAVATTAALLLAVTPFVLRPSGDSQRADGEIERLQQERQRVLSEIESLRQRAARPLPVVYLGGDEKVDLVLDLDELVRRRGPARAEPAVYRPSGGF